jgi:hypothetical protein
MERVFHNILNVQVYIDNLLIHTDTHEKHLEVLNKVEAPPQDGNGGYLDATTTKWKNNSVNNVMQFFKRQMFRAALPGDIRKVVAQNNQNTIILGDIYQVETNTQREAISKTTRPWKPSMRMTRMKLLPSRTGKTRGSKTN